MNGDKQANVKQATASEIFNSQMLNKFRDFLAPRQADELRFCDTDLACRFHSTVRYQSHLRALRRDDLGETSWFGALWEFASD
jgi:hypothetical protein